MLGHRAGVVCGLAVGVRWSSKQQRVTDVISHLNDSDAQVVEVNAILRKQSQSITMLTDAMLFIQEVVADLRATIHNDVTSKLRATEQKLYRNLAAQ